MLIRSILPALVTLLLSTGSPGASPAEWPCRDAVARLLNRWKSPMALTELEPAGFVYSAAGPGPGELVRISWDKGAAVVEKFDARAVGRLAFAAAGCAPDYAVEPLSPVGTGFGDAELSDLLRRTGERRSAALLYFWSPRMNLSIRGAAEAIEAARRQKMELVALVDPDAPAEEVAASITRYRLPAEFARRNVSRDLAARFTGRHYPCTLVASNGVLKGVALPGYVSATRLERTIRQRLGEK